MPNRSRKGCGTSNQEDQEGKPYFEIDLSRVPLAVQLWTIRALREVLKREHEDKVDKTTAKSYG